MAVIKQKDSRSGITYVYEASYVWDKEKKQSRSTRKLLGRLDEETGEIIPTDGRGRKRSPLYQRDDESKETSMVERIRELEKENGRLISENEMLKARIAILEKCQQGTR